MIVESSQSERALHTDTRVDGPELLARVFTGLNDATRLRILLLLLEHERNVSDLVAQIGLSQGRISAHLQCLHWCGFVVRERRGKYVYYRVADPQVRELLQLAQNLVLVHAERLATCTVLDEEVAPRYHSQSAVE